MCNRYRQPRSSAAVARKYRAADRAGGGNQGEFVFPGYPGLVVAGGEVRTMAWGFPLVLKGKSDQPLKPKPVNNARTDKLDSFMWRFSFQERRCLIPVSALPSPKARRLPGGRPLSCFSCERMAGLRYPLDGYAVRNTARNSRSTCKVDAE
jgi:putative SOS response-associated peptidase YedK